MSESCARGCVQARRHVTDCEDRDTCPGCFPRPALHGLLCVPCHESLVDWLKHAPGQHALLKLAEEPTLVQQLGNTGSAEVDAPAPLNLDALTVGLYLTDVLSSWVEMLAADYQMAGPPSLTTNALLEGNRPPWPRWSHYAGSLVWEDPPAVFEIRSACTWLLAQIVRLEHCPGIGDLWTELGDVMARAHAIAPWRELLARLKGIECPECHRFALAHHGGDEHVTCGKCNAKITPGRYAIWVRYLVAERKKEAI